MPSTVIKSHSYNPDDEVLTISFVTGKVYRYYKVTENQYHEFKKAFSKGTYFNKYIKPCHSFKELTT